MSRDLARDSISIPKKWVQVKIRGKEKRVKIEDTKEQQNVGMSTSNCSLFQNDFIENVTSSDINVKIL